MLVIMGPTASGKSALALALATRLGGEIVSADSMQVYRGLDIGTAKPTAAERALVPHHLLDVLDLSEPMDAARYVGLAETAIAEIHARGRRPVVVGGSGLYLKALLYGLDAMPPGDPALRLELEAEYPPGAAGLARLQERLAGVDPVAAARGGGNRRRLLRALEVTLLTGQPMSAHWRRNGQLRHAVSAVRLAWPRDELRRRIRARTQEMLRQGWIEEAAALIRRGLLAAPTARQALGYDLIGEHLAGKLDRTELSERLELATWHYARRQETWFRRQHPEAKPLPMPADVEQMLAAVTRPDEPG